MTDTIRVRDVEFELAMLTPAEARLMYPDRVGALDSPLTTTYAVAKCETAKGPFICILPLNGQAALRERDLAKKLVSAAYDELARMWAEEGYDRVDG